LVSSISSRRDSPCKKNPITKLYRITKVYVLLRDKLMWGAFITFFIKSYLKLYVSSALGV
jgi:hypothetical protein